MHGKTNKIILQSLVSTVKDITWRLISTAYIIIILSYKLMNYNLDIKA